MLPDDREFRFEIYDRIIKNKKIFTFFALEELTIKSWKEIKKSRRYFVDKKILKIYNLI